MNFPKKILLVQLYSNGDCLYATAVARQIKHDFPEAHLTWAIAGFCKSILVGNPYVDEIMEVNDVAKNDVASFRRFRKRIYELKQQGVFDNVFITHNIDRNHAFYDGSIRSSILKAYPFPISVPVTPVLRLTTQEKANTDQFIKSNNLKRFRNIILFEFAPLSGQLRITREVAIAIAEELTSSADTAVILSSANSVNHSNPAIIDGSTLSLRETAGLTHYCTLLLGCSSGITWISTADTSKLLPMVQILNADTTWVNPVSRDFERFNISADKVIELLQVDKNQITDCIKLAMQDFCQAKKIYNQPIPLHFKTTRSIVYNLLCYFEFGAIIKHIRVNHEVYGFNPRFYKELIIGLLIAPFTLIKNITIKRIFGRAAR